MKLSGRAWKFGDNINTDEIIPARYLNTISPQELAAHCMEDADPSFPGKVRRGDMIVAGWNFGCGSSREHAPLAIKHAGVSCVIAASFARIFFRNAINTGLWIFECPAAGESVETGDELSADVESGAITVQRTGNVLHCQQFSREIMDIVEAGGLMAYVKRQLREGGSNQCTE